MGRRRRHHRRRSCDKHWRRDDPRPRRIDPDGAGRAEPVEVSTTDRAMQLVGQWPAQIVRHGHRRDEPFDRFEGGQGGDPLQRLQPG